MESKVMKEIWKGGFNFEKQTRMSKGILTQKGKEYYVKYNDMGSEISRNRTFEGIRLMIIGNRYFYLFFCIVKIFNLISKGMLGKLLLKED